MTVKQRAVSICSNPFPNKVGHKEKSWIFLCVPCWQLGEFGLQDRETESRSGWGGRHSWTVGGWGARHEGAGTALRSARQVDWWAEPGLVTAGFVGWKQAVSNKDVSTEQGMEE